MIVVAQPQALAREPGRGLVQLAGDAPYAVGVGEPGRRQVRDDDGVRAEGPARHHGLGLLTHGQRVHAARGQARRIHVGTQAVRVTEDAERFHRAVSEGGDPLQHPRAVGGHLFTDGIKL